MFLSPVFCIGHVRPPLDSILMVGKTRESRFSGLTFATSVATTKGIPDAINQFSLCLLSASTSPFGRNQVNDWSSNAGLYVEKAPNCSRPTRGCDKSPGKSVLHEILPSFWPFFEQEELESVSTVCVSPRSPLVSLVSFVSKVALACLL
jgi:hypothetical protein